MFSICLKSTILPFNWIVHNSRNFSYSNHTNNNYIIIILIIAAAPEKTYSVDKKMDFGNNFDVETNPLSLHSSTPSTDAGSSTSGQQQTEAALLFSVIILCLIFFIICSWRQYFKNCSAASCSCYRNQFPRDSREIQTSEQFYEDRALAESLQSRMNEEERERERLVKRKERRMWYEYYIKPWTVVSRKEVLMGPDPGILRYL